MANVPNTTTSGQVLTSVGDGSNASKWGTVTSGGGSGITQLTGDVTAGPGSGSIAATVAKINGTTLGTLTGATNGQVLTWNTSTSTWVPSAGLPTGSAAGQLLVWSGSAWTATLGGYASTGSMLYNDATYGWSSTTGPTTSGQFYSWNGSAWALTFTSAFGANNAWSSESNSLSLSSTLSQWGVVAVTGYSNYMIVLSSTMSGNTTTARLQQQVYQGGTGLVGPLIGINPGATSTTYVMNVVQHLATGLTPSLSYNFYGYAGVTSGTGNVINGTITVVGIS